MPHKDAAREKALKLARWASEKKALRPVVLDVRRNSGFCDYFVIVSGESTTQVRAIYNALIDKASLEHLSVAHREDDHESHWLLIDCIDVVVHIFLEEERKYYDLEYLWRKARRVSSSAVMRRKRRSVTPKVKKNRRTYGKT